LTYAKNVALKLLAAKLNTIQLPNQAGNKDTVKYTVTNIFFRNIVVPDATITLQNGAFFVAISGVSGSISADWSGKEDIWPHPSGHGTVSADWAGVTMTALIAFGAANGKPTATAISTACVIDHFNLHVSGSGILGVIAEILAWLFGGLLKGLAESEVTSALKSGIDSGLNSFLQTLPTEVLVGSTAELNTSLVPPNIALTPSTLSVNVRGFFVDLADRADVPPYVPTTMPSVLAANEMVQIFLGDWVPDSASWIFTHQGKLNLSLTVDMMKASPFPFNTSNWKVPVPQMYSKYPGWSMTASLGPMPNQPPITLFTPAGITVMFLLGLDVSVVSPTGGVISVFSLGLNVTATVAVSVANNRVYMKLAYLGFKVAVLNTFVGPIDVTAINSELLFISQDILLPYVNQFLTQGIAIPMVDKVELQNTVVQYGQGWLGLLSNVVYTG